MPAPDLKAHAKTLRDPDKFFVHEVSGTFLVVEHATGEPKYRVDGDNLVPYEKTPQTPAAASDMAADAGKLDLTAKVTNPAKRPR